jgi:epoxyqueuosine reductase
MDRASIIKQRALEVGFDLVGIAPRSAPKDLEFLPQWLKRGFGGEMRYLADPRREDPSRVLPSVKSVICVALIYNTSYPYSTEEAVRNAKRETRNSKFETRNSTGSSFPRRRESRVSWTPASARETLVAPSFEFRISSFEKDAHPRGWISRYAWGKDYHNVMRGKLELLRKGIEKLAPSVQTRIYVDTGPILERAFARLAGIGWVGKNTCLINESKGSWFFLGVILTNLELESDLPPPDRCGSCTRCLEACPTGALVEPYVMDASRCISYFDIELKGGIPEEFRAAIGANIFGCDICQDVCPWNNRLWSDVRGPASKDDTHQSVARTGAFQVRSSSSEKAADLHNRAVLHTQQSPVATTSQPEFQPMQVEVKARDSGLGLRDSGRRRDAIQTLQVDSRLRGNDGIHGARLRHRHSREGGNPLHESFPVSESPKSQDPPIPPVHFSLFNPPLENLVCLTEEDFRRVFAHSPVKRVKYRGWLRNLCVAAGNSGNRQLIPWLEEMARHTDSLVREHAGWALRQLQRSEFEIRNSKFDP